MRTAAEKLTADLRDPSRVKLAVFLGGSAHGFQMQLSHIKKLFDSLKKICGVMGDCVVTTSRRTPEEISRFLKEQVSREPFCQAVIIANEDKRPEVVSGMMALADVLLVTEDSISMISEALASGKKVLVIRFDSGGFPAKHERFKEFLRKESAIQLAGLDDLEEKILDLQDARFSGLAAGESHLLKDRLQKIL